GGEIVAGSGRLGALAGYQSSHAAFSFATQGWLAAVAVGLWLRYLDRRRRGMAEAVRRDERLAMARALHDVVAHHITGIVVQTQAARITARRRRDTADPDGLDTGLDTGSDAGLDATLAEIEAASGEALTAMRRVVGLLRDADDAATTGVGAGPGELAELVKRFDGHGPAVTLSLPAQEELRWPPEIASTVYRVVQESLTNIARHAAHARCASVRIARNPQDGIRIEVTDDAPAGAPRHLHRGGFGLVGMRERVEALGGTLDAGPQPAPASGWAVTATVPLPGPVSVRVHGARS
ncbi:sensor histidine kinase, partial [Catenulispora pinisilvae]|uniref:sensor histidine kinase n=1 Tax=Catenulispora pinisilvae TaxID=2705253 RepID=UPI001E608AF5